MNQTAAIPLSEYPVLLTVAHVCVYFSVSKDHVRNLLDEGALDGIDIASPGSARPCWRIPRASVEAFEKKGKTI
jgi:excisionase family DNA binding protein